MTQGVRPSPAAKDSGVGPLGFAPAHWDVCRLKRICRLEYGDSLADDSRVPGEIAVYGSNGVVGQHDEANTIAGVYALIGRQGALCGNVHLARGRFWASEHAVVTNLHGDHAPEWFVSVLQAMNLNQYSIAAAQPGLSVDRVLNLWAPVPPQCEQRTIVRFLDHATSRIDRYIRAKEKLIALLEEQQRAAINEAVTGQINVRTGRSYPVYKDSGVEWLQAVPGHWDVRPAQWHLREVEGRVGPIRRCPVVGHSGLGRDCAGGFRGASWPESCPDFSTLGQASSCGG